MSQSIPGEPLTLSEKEFILLGLITEEPSHAYGMETKIRDRRMHVWTEIGFSSIYRVLDKLEKRALIRAHLVHEGRGATRKVHVVTPEGERAFAAGIEARLVAPCHPKDPAAVAFMYARTLSLERLREVLSLRREQISAGLKTMTAAREAAENGGPMPCKDDEAPKDMEAMSLGKDSSDEARYRASSESSVTPPHLQLLFGRASRLLEAEQRFLDDSIADLAGDEGSARYEGWTDWVTAWRAQKARAQGGSVSEENQGDEK
jgi:DNA-binding PadR family transcriptional regulator